MNTPHPTQGDVIAYKSAAKLINKRPKDSINVLKKLHSNHPLWLEPLLILAEQALINNHKLLAKEREELTQKLHELEKCGDPRVLFLLGREYADNGDLKQGIKALQSALEKQPEFHLASQWLASLLLRQESWKDAEEILVKQLEHFPNTTHLQVNLAVALMRQNHLERALVLAEQSLKTADIHQLASIHLNIGTILQELGQRKAAQEHYEQTLQLNKDNINARLNLGVVAFQNKDLKTAKKYFLEVLDRDKQDCRASVNLAGVLLLQDNAEEGWKFYEKRVHENTTIMQQPDQLSIWKGEQINGSLILLHEQGLGDTFQFIRYASLLKQKGIKCFFRGPKKLHSLILGSKMVDGCIEDNDPIPSDAKAWIAMMSIPSLIGASVRNPIMTKSPYLQINAEKIRQWSNKLGPKRNLRLALHWQGNPDHEFTISRGRSFPLKILEPLIELDSVEFISLQKGPGSEQCQQSAFDKYWHSNQQEIDNTWDFEDAAAILQCCDGLVSSDSGLAHLAGACGIKTWLLLPWLAEWRWGIEGRSTAWYPNHVLLRQNDEGNWDGPIDQLMRILRKA